MLATRAMSYIVRGDYQAAAEWAERATKAPNAHIHIHAIAALAHELAGKTELARCHVDIIRQCNRAYCQDDFFKAFRFAEEDMLSCAQAALAGLGL